MESAVINFEDRLKRMDQTSLRKVNELHIEQAQREMNDYEQRRAMSYQCMAWQLVSMEAKSDLAQIKSKEIVEGLDDMADMLKHSFSFKREMLQLVAKELKK